MPEYRAYIVKTGQLGRPQELDCPDDEAAITQAQQLVDGCFVELWNGKRFVALIGRDGVRSKTGRLVGSQFASSRG